MRTAGLDGEGLVAEWAVNRGIPPHLVAFDL